jgi:hypothetical protein
VEQARGNDKTQAIEHRIGTGFIGTPALLAQVAGGAVAANSGTPELGPTTLTLRPEAATDPLFHDLPGTVSAIERHVDAITALKDAGAEIPKALETVVKEFRDARREAANHRGAKTAEKQRADDAEAKLTQVLQALGVKDGEDPPDPDALAKTVADRDDQLRKNTVEFAAYKAATRLGADPDALLDSRTFLAKLEKLDPSSDTYTADLESAVNEAKESNPKLSASHTPRSGPAQGARQTTGGIDSQIAEAERKGDVREAIRLKNQRFLSSLTNQ